MVGLDEGKVRQCIRVEWPWTEWRGWDVVRLFKTTELNGTYKRG